MALFKCPECGREVSDQSDACVYCGYPFVKKEKQPLKSHVIGYRGGAGYITWFSIVILILGVIFIVPSVLLGIAVPEMWPFSIFIIILSSMLILIANVGFVNMGINANNHNECITYDETDQKLVLSTIGGKIIRIDPSAYVELKDNYFTDNLLKFTYRTSSGALRRVNLGYCRNREELRKGIKKVQDSLKDN